MSDKASKNSEEDISVFLNDFRSRWSRARLSLLYCHIAHALDECRDLGGLGEIEDMDEAEQLIMELTADLKKIVPEKREKIDIKKLELELFKEREVEDEV